MLIVGIAVSRGEVQTDERKHQSTRPVVVDRPDRHPGVHGCVANEALERVLRSQKARVNNRTGVVSRPPVHPRPIFVPPHVHHSSNLLLLLKQVFLSLLRLVTRVVGYFFHQNNLAEVTG